MDEGRSERSVFDIAVLCKAIGEYSSVVYSALKSLSWSDHVRIAFPSLEACSLTIKSQLHAVKRCLLLLQGLLRRTPWNQFPSLGECSRGKQTTTHITWRILE